MRIKGHKDACKKDAIEKSTIAEHAWTNQHPVLWDETTVIDQARRQTELFLKNKVSFFEDVAVSSALLCVTIMDC